MESNSGRMENVATTLKKQLETPLLLRLTLIPVLMILVIPFYIYIPSVQQSQLLKLINETVAYVRNQTRHGP